MPASEAGRIDWRLALPRAAFLACSWTWCIGMYLPVILVREFGWPGWVAFAIPNIVGAAAVPFVMRTREASGRFVERHEGAMRWFSSVTIAFHAMFLTWIGSLLLAWMAGAMDFGVRSVHIGGAALALTAGLIGLAGARLPFRWWAAISPVVWLGSVGLVAMVVLLAPTPEATAPPLARALDLALVAPVMVFGFALCPFLDLTFHRVRRESDTPTARAAFVLGFGALFLVMILGSLGYARGVLASGPVGACLLAHFGMQSAFTIGAHAREVGAAVRTNARTWTFTPLLVGIALGLLPVSGVGGRLGVTGETVYLGFMGMYALAFPALVWAFWGRDEWAPAQRRRALAGWAIACLVGAPALWLGFVDKHYIWLGPGVILGLLARPIAARCARSGS